MFLGARYEERTTPADTVAEIESFHELLDQSWYIEYSLLLASQGISLMEIFYLECLSTLKPLLIQSIFI